MQYENPPLPEGINVTDEHPLREFSLLLVGVSAAVLVGVVVLAWLAGALVRFIPASVEQRLASAQLADVLSKPACLAPGHAEVQRYLERLSMPLAARAGLPPDMPLQVHFVHGDEVNALALPGGHILVYEGLYRAMPSENALALVIGHEIAHIKHRDPLVAAGRGVVIALALGSLAGFGDGAADSMVSVVGSLTALSFSRDQERAADALALQMLAGQYGHIADADKVFEVLRSTHGVEPPALFSTHPVSEDRIAATRVAARHYAADGPVTALQVSLPRAGASCAAKGS